MNTEIKKISILKEANLAFRNGDYFKALKLYEQIINEKSLICEVAKFNYNLANRRLNNGLLIQDIKSKHWDECWASYQSGDLDTAKRLVAEYSVGHLVSREISTLIRQIQNTQYYISKVTERALLEKVRQYNLNKKNRKAKVVVYSALIGNYDIPKLPETINNDWDYVLFSDNELSGEHVFEVRKPEVFFPDKTRIARYIKTHPEEFFSEYEYSVWIDSSILIRGEHLSQTIEECIRSGALVVCNPHPKRDCILQELEACIAANKDDAVIMTQQVNRYYKEGLSKPTGMYATGLLIRRHNDEKVKLFDSIWWDEIEKGSKRDQLSVMYALKKAFVHSSRLIGTKKFTDYKDNDYLCFPHKGQISDVLPVYKPPSFYGYRESSTKIVSIVIPVYNALSDVQKCLDSVLAKKDGYQLQINVVNDCSDEDTSTWLRSFCGANVEFNLIEHESNQGYTRSVNDGMKASYGSYVVLLNSDTIVTNGWLDGMIRCMNSNPEFGIVGPLSNAASSQNVPSLYDVNGNFAINELPTNIDPDDMAYIIARKSQRLYPLIPFVNGFCFMIKREVINQIGYMDHESFPIGYGEENDYCIRALDAGFLLAIADDAYVYHAKSKSFGHDKRALLSEQGAQQIIRKHSSTKYKKLKGQLKRTCNELERMRADVADELAQYSKNKSLLSRVPMPKMRDLIFVYNEKHRTTGSTIMRGAQLSTILKDNLSSLSYIKEVLFSSSTQFNDSILFLTKGVLKKITAEELQKLKQQNNILLFDFVDDPVRSDLVPFADLLIASSHSAYLEYLSKYPSDKIHLITHHVDPRIQGVMNKSNTFKIAYFGELVNTFKSSNLEKVVDFIQVDTNKINDGWISRLANYSFHYAIRANNVEGRHKPFLKGFTAAAMGCNLLVQRSHEAVHYLTEEYPYLYDGIVEENAILNKIKEIEADFGSSRWRFGLSIMRDIKDQCSISNIIKEFNLAIDKSLQLVQDASVGGNIKPVISQEKIIVYTCNFGKYETVKPLKFVDPRVNYILFTDESSLKVDGWTTVVIDSEIVNPRRKSRLPKILPHKYLPPHDISIYLDSSLSLKESDILKLVDMCLGFSDIALYPHNERNCVYDEINYCMNIESARRVDKQICLGAIKKLLDINYPRGAGLFENGFIIRRNNKLINELNEIWWDEYMKGSERDQFVFMPCLWRLGIKPNPIKIGKQIRDNPFMDFHKHRYVKFD